MVIYRELTQPDIQAHNWGYESHSFTTVSETNSGQYAAIADIIIADNPSDTEKGAAPVYLPHKPEAPRKPPRAKQALGYDGGSVSLETLSSSIEVSGSNIQISASIIPPASQQISTARDHENDIQSTDSAHERYYSLPTDGNQQDKPIDNLTVNQGSIGQGAPRIADDHGDAEEEEYMDQEMVHGYESISTETHSTGTIAVNEPTDSQDESEDTLYDTADDAARTVEASPTTTTTEQPLRTKVTINLHEDRNMAKRLARDKRNSEPIYPSDNQIISDLKESINNSNSIHRIKRSNTLDISQPVSQQNLPVAVNSRIETSDTPVPSSSDNPPPYSTLPRAGTDQDHDGASGSKISQAMETQHCRITQNSATAKNDSIKEPYSEGGNIASPKTPVPLSPLSNDATLITASITTSPYSPTRPNIIPLGIGLPRSISKVLVGDDGSDEEDQVE